MWCASRYANGMWICAPWSVMQASGVKSLVKATASRDCQAAAKRAGKSLMLGAIFLSGGILFVVGEEESHL